MDWLDLLAVQSTLKSLLLRVLLHKSTQIGFVINHCMEMFLTRILMTPDCTFKKKLLKHFILILFQMYRLYRRKAMTNLASILENRHYFANKGPSSQSYDFSSGHI